MNANQYLASTAGVSGTFAVSEWPTVESMFTDLYAIEGNMRVRPAFNDEEWTGRNIENFAHLSTETYRMEPHEVEEAQAYADEFATLFSDLVPDFQSRMGWTENRGKCNVNRILAGSERFRRTRIRRRSAPPTITLTVNMWTSAFVGQECIRMRASALGALASILEGRGARVRILGTYSGRDTHGSDQHHMAIVVLKDFHQRTNFATSLGVLSPWFYRTALFGTININDNQHGTAGRNGGNPHLDDDQIRDICRLDGTVTRFANSLPRSQEKCRELLEKEARRVVEALREQMEASR